MTTVTWTIIDRISAYSYLLKEDTYFLLLENGGKIIISSVDWSSRTVPSATWTNRTAIDSALSGNY